MIWNTLQICASVFPRETEKFSAAGSAPLCRETAKGGNKQGSSPDIKSRTERFLDTHAVTRPLWRRQEMPENHQGWLHLFSGRWDIYATFCSGPSHRCQEMPQRWKRSFTGHVCARERKHALGAELVHFEWK